MSDGNEYCEMRQKVYPKLNSITSNLKIRPNAMGYMCAAPNNKTTELVYHALGQTFPYHAPRQYKQNSLKYVLNQSAVVPHFVQASR